MKERPFSRRVRWGVEGVKRVLRLSRLEVEFHPRSLGCVGVSRLVLLFTLNLVV